MTRSSFSNLFSFLLVLVLFTTTISSNSIRNSEPESSTKSAAKKMEAGRAEAQIPSVVSRRLQPDLNDAMLIKFASGTGDNVYNDLPLSFTIGGFEEASSESNAAGIVTFEGSLPFNGSIAVTVEAANSTDWTLNPSNLVVGIDTPARSVHVKGDGLGLVDHMNGNGQLLLFTFILDDMNLPPNAGIEISSFTVSKLARPRYILDGKVDRKYSAGTEFIANTALVPGSRQRIGFADGPYTLSSLTLKTYEFSQNELVVDFVGTRHGHFDLPSAFTVEVAGSNVSSQEWLTTSGELDSAVRGSIKVTVEAAGFQPAWSFDNSSNVITIPDPASEINADKSFGWGVLNGMVGTTQLLALSFGFGNLTLPSNQGLRITKFTVATNRTKHMQPRFIVEGQSNTKLRRSKELTVNSPLYPDQRIGFADGKYFLHSLTLQTFPLLARRESLAVIDATFDQNDTAGFVFVPGLFRNTNHSGTEHIYEIGTVSAEDSLQVYLGGIDNDEAVGMSGGWQSTYTLERSANVVIDFTYVVLFSNALDSGEDFEVLCSVDGKLHGMNSSVDYVDRFVGYDDDRDDWRLYPRQNRSANFDIGGQPAGRHVVALGGYLSKKTSVWEHATVQFNDVRVLATEFESTPQPTAQPGFESTAETTHSPSGGPTVQPSLESTPNSAFGPTADPPVRPPAVASSERPTVGPTLRPVIGKSYKLPTSNPFADQDLRPSSDPTLRPSEADPSPTTGPSLVDHDSRHTSEPTLRLSIFEPLSSTSGPTSQQSRRTSGPVSEVIFLPTGAPMLGPTWPPRSDPGSSSAPPSTVPTTTPETRSDPLSELIFRPSVGPTPHPTFPPSIYPSGEPTTAPRTGSAPNSELMLPPTVAPTSESPLSPTSYPGTSSAPSSTTIFTPTGSTSAPGEQPTSTEIPLATYLPTKMAQPTTLNPSAKTSPSPSIAAPNPGPAQSDSPTTEQSDMPTTGQSDMPTTGQSDMPTSPALTSLPTVTVLFPTMTPMRNDTPLPSNRTSATIAPTLTPTASPTITVSKISPTTNATSTPTNRPTHYLTTVSAPPTADSSMSGSPRSPPPSIYMPETRLLPTLVPTFKPVLPTPLPTLNRSSPSSSYPMPTLKAPVTPPPADQAIAPSFKPELTTIPTKALTSEPDRHSTVKPTGSNTSSTITRPTTDVVPVIVRINSYVSGQRLFNITIDGVLAFQNLDIVAETGGRGEPMFKYFFLQNVTKEYIQIEMVATDDRALISGIEVIQSIPHFAHSVPGGPYEGVDRDGSGEGSVHVNGVGSHTHNNGDDLVVFRWLGENGTEIGDGVMANLTLPVGIHQIFLYVEDSVSSATSGTTVTVQQFGFPAIDSVAPEFIDVGGKNNTLRITGVGFNYTEMRTVVHMGTYDLSGPDAIEIIDDNTIQVNMVPKARSTTGDVLLSVATPLGETPGIKFPFVDIPIEFEVGVVSEMEQLSVLEFGPDGKLYVATTDAKLFKLTLNEQYQVTRVVESQPIESRRVILGIAFDPSDTKPNPTVYISNSIIYHGGKDNPWEGLSINAKVSAVSGPNLTNVQDIVTGLPTSGADHSVNGLEFDNDGNLYIQVGGNTNMGIPGDFLMNFDESYYSASTLKAYLRRPNFDGDITYDDNGRPTGGFDVELYAVGERNSFNIILHTNGYLYGTDNGPNDGFGRRSESCSSSNRSLTEQDKLSLIQEGRYYGHPNRKRGRSGDSLQCIWRSAYSASEDEYTAPLLTMEASTNGIVEFRSEHFGGSLRGNLILSTLLKTLGSVALTENGLGVVEDYVQEIDPNGGLDVTQGPDGTLFITQRIKARVIYLKPIEPHPNEAATAVVKSVFPRRGPQRGGNILSIYGANFDYLDGSTTIVRVCTGTCYPVAILSSKKLSCILAPGISGSRCDVVVADGTQTSTMKDAYIYVT